MQHMQIQQQQAIIIRFYTSREELTLFLSTTPFPYVKTILIADIPPEVTSALGYAMPSQNEAGTTPANLRSRIFHIGNITLDTAQNISEQLYFNPHDKIILLDVSDDIIATFRDRLNSRGLPINMVITVPITVDDILQLPPYNLYQATLPTSRAAIPPAPVRPTTNAGYSPPISLIEAPTLPRPAFFSRDVQRNPAPIKGLFSVTRPANNPPRINHELLLSDMRAPNFANSQRIFANILPGAEIYYDMTSDHLKIKFHEFNSAHAFQRNFNALLLQMNHAQNLTEMIPTYYPQQNSTCYHFQLKTRTAIKLFFSNYLKVYEDMIDKAQKAFPASNPNIPDLSLLQKFICIAVGNTFFSRLGYFNTNLHNQPPNLRCPFLNKQGQICIIFSYRALIGLEQINNYLHENNMKMIDATQHQLLLALIENDGKFMPDFYSEIDAAYAKGELKAGEDVKHTGKLAADERQRYLQLCCPISYRLIRDPVMVGELAYERAEITKILGINPTEPRIVSYAAFKYHIELFIQAYKAQRLPPINLVQPPTIAHATATLAPIENKGIKVEKLPAEQKTTYPVYSDDVEAALTLSNFGRRS